MLSQKLLSRRFTNKLITQAPILSHVNYYSRHNYYSNYHYELPVFGVISKICPSSSITNFIHSCYETSNIPYVVTIAALPFITRFILKLPLDVLCTKKYESKMESIPILKEQKFDALTQILRNRSFRWNNMHLKYLKMAKSLFFINFVNNIPIFLMGYIHLSVYISLERMKFLDNSSILWITDGLSSSDPLFILPILNGICLMFCYADINKYKWANIQKRRQNLKLCLLFMPFSACFFTSAYNIYILSSIISIITYNNTTIFNSKFQNKFGLLSNNNKLILSENDGLLSLYIRYNLEVNYFSKSFSLFTKDWCDNKTEIWDNLNCVINDSELFKPILPDKQLFRNLNINDEIYDKWAYIMEEKNKLINTTPEQRLLQNTEIDENYILDLGDDYNKLLLLSDNDTDSNQTKSIESE